MLIYNYDLAGTISEIYGAKDRVTQIDPCDERRSNEYHAKIIRKRSGVHMYHDIKPISYACQKGEADNLGLPHDSQLCIEALPDENGRKRVAIHLAAQRLGKVWDESHGGYRIIM